MLQMDSAGLSVAEYNRLPLFSRVSFGISQKNAQQSKYSDSYRIIQVFDDAQRRKGSQLGGNQHLRSVRDDALDDTRESIQDTCTLAFVHPVTGSDVVGQWSHCDDGYRIVGCTEIGDAHQSCDAKFGSAFAVDVFGQFLLFSKVPSMSVAIIRTWEKECCIVNSSKNKFSAGNCETVY